MNLDTAFCSIYGRAPSPEETNRFNRIGKELGIRDNDAIWAIAFLLGHHLDLAKQMPEQIDKLISQSLARYATSLDSARRLAETDPAAKKARIEETVGNAVVKSAQREIARAAQTVAQITARKSWLQWLGGAAVVGMLLIGGAFYWGYVIGNTNGYARALDVKAVSAWAASSEGQAAYKLDQDGDLRSLIRCDRDGWTVQRSQDGKHKLCIVRPPAMVMFPDGMSRRLLGKGEHYYRGNKRRGVKAAVGHRVSGAQRPLRLVATTRLKMVRIRADVMTFEP